MRELIVRKNDAGQRLDKFLFKTLTNMPPALLYKSIRTKKIKVNRHRASPSLILSEGDALQLFLSDEFFKQADNVTPALAAIHPRLDILYEDDHILLLNKRPGVSVHEDEHQTTDNLLVHLQAYLYQKGEYSPKDEQSFAPALCNRIDRNTGGIVIAAKTADALRIMNEKIRAREIDKFYLCLVHGRPKKEKALLTAFLCKMTTENRVLVYDKKQDAPRHLQSSLREIRTKYRTLQTKEDTSLLEVELLTGRTHQIRAHLAHVGHPLLGDGKYGKNREDKAFGFKYQALYAYKLRFTFKDARPHALSYLKDKEFSLPADSIYFLRDFHLPPENE